MKPSSATAAPISILLVEDEAETREILSRMLTIKLPEIRLLCAENGKSGLELYQEHRPDLVITDVNMPLMDGLSMAGVIRELHQETHIIVLTAYNDTHYLLHAIEAGISHYVLKPINQRKLFASIDNCLDRIRLERQVREQEKFIRKLSRAVERSPSMVMITAHDGTVEYVNPRFTEITGYADGDIVGKNLRSRLNDNMAADVAEELWKTISSGNDWRGELQNRTKGGERYWESVAITSIADEQGAITNFVIEKEDITRRKMAEEEIESLNVRLAERAAELEALNGALEAFNYTVSHDLRTPLTVINGYNQLLRERYGDRLDQDGAGYLQTIADEVQQMNKLIRSLLEFSRLGRQNLECSEIDLSNLAKAVAEDLKQKMPERVVTFVLQDGICCSGDYALLRVVLANLLGNAWKYTGRNEKAIIEFGALVVQGEPAYFVRDNGAGFDMAKAELLFAPFQRLHSAEEFEGHGIGLATVAQIIKRHNGRVWAEGIPGSGATIYFTLGMDKPSTHALSR
jgi:PAS domain S-box-containing protein